MNLHTISEKAYETCESALKTLGELPDEVSLHAFITEATKVGDYDDYKVIPEKARNIIKNVITIAGESGARAFLRAAIAQSVINAVQSEHIKKLSTLVASHHIRQLARISNDSELQAEWLNIDHDLFQKEFGIATFRLYAVGAQLIDPRCGVPRSYLIKGGLSDVPNRLVTILIRLGGFRPYFQIHTHKFMLDMFNEQGWEECYRGCAALYALHPRVRGMMGGSWFYDPAVAAISPRLSYLRDTPLQNGAHVMFVEAGGDAINNSLATSPTRRKLYEEGAYVPKSYMLIWGKQQQIAWATNTP